MANATAIKFGHPESVVFETDRWSVQVRPQQPTLGALVLVCKEPAQAFSDLSPQAFSELKTVVESVESLLRRFVGYERINYLMLMMVDLDVHFHVLPRYEGDRSYDGLTFTDAGWPGQPKLDQAVALDADAVRRLAGALREAGSSAS